jgi:5-methylcytosine-specific restriction endonuclease McrA
MTKRKRLTLTQKVELLGTHALCPECREPYSGSVEFDHVVPLALCGADDEGNLVPLCAPCHASKTSGDIARIAKAKRQGGEKGQQARRKAGKTRTIPSRGFDARYRKRLNGEVEKRA